MKRWIAMVMAMVMVFSFSGCNVTITEEDIQNGVSQAADGLSEFVDEHGDEIADAGRQLATNLWGELIGCEHTPHTYRKGEVKVVCLCGANSFDHVDYEVFVDCIPSGLFHPDSWFRDEANYALHEYAKYIALYYSVDSDIMEFLVTLHKWDVDAVDSHIFQTAYSFAMNVYKVTKMATGVDTKMMNGISCITPDSYQGKVTDYMGAASTTFKLIKTVFDLNVLHKLQNDSSADNTEVFHAMATVIRDGTNWIPGYGFYFSEMLYVLEEGFAVLDDGAKFQIVMNTMYMDIATNTADSIFTYEPWSNLHVKNPKTTRESDWKNGPSLQEMEQANLSADMMAGLAPYIEFRLNYEIEQMLGVGLAELAATYQD